MGRRKRREGWSEGLALGGAVAVHDRLRPLRSSSVERERNDGARHQLRDRTPTPRELPHRLRESIRVAGQDHDDVLSEVLPDELGDPDRVAMRGARVRRAVFLADHGLDAEEAAHLAVAEKTLLDAESRESRTRGLGAVDSPDGRG